MRRKRWSNNCDLLEEARQWEGFLLMFSTSISLIHQKTVKNACTVQRGFPLSGKCSMHHP